MSRAHWNRKKLHFHDILLMIAGILLSLTMLSIWLVCGLYAKYVVSDSWMDSARVAKAGIGKLELLEHEVKLVKGEYELIEDENHVGTGNVYDTVIPGVNIAKDPFVRLEIADSAEMRYELYIKVEENNFPTYTITTGNDSTEKQAVTYEVDKDFWEEVTGQPGVYKYKDTISSDFKKDIYILKGNKLEVSEHYVGNGKFTLTFKAWLRQAGAE